MTRDVRVRRGVAQTPVARYRNRRTGRAVTLIATMHVGTNEYFSELNAIIAQLEAAGCLICCEGIRPAADRQWDTAADEERAVRGFPSPMAAQGLAAMARYLGWVG